MNIGFSTGSVAKSNVELAIEIISQTSANAIELSALRENEIEILMNKLNALNISNFDYISVHVPSKLEKISEKDLIQLLEPAIEKKIPLIVHPDIICDFDLWQQLGDLVCIENMDKRKSIGRDYTSLKDIFIQLPNAKFCFDLGHAKQVDPTLSEAKKIARNFNTRLHQYHLSDVGTQSLHKKLNWGCVYSLSRMREHLLQDIPIILESPIFEIEDLTAEIEQAKNIFINSAKETTAA